MTETNYDLEPWELLDAEGRRYGIFDAEGYSPDPVAIFRSEDEAAAWMKWCESRGDDNPMGNCDYVICPIDRLAGFVWNSHDTPPGADNA